MKKIILTLISILILVTVFTRPVYAIDKEQALAIEKLLDDACNKSGVPGMSISIITGDESLYFYSGYANREEKLQASEKTLYELASVSKAFTATGILLLEEQGKLSMSDPIQNYIPWLSFKYKGEDLDMEVLTLNHFLHHTSGLTNNKHIQDIPQGDSSDMLEKTVETFKGAELEFPPGEKYSYGTINYDVLGLVIELVTGKSYEGFMIEEIFQPLSLNDTYLYEETARESGQLAKGYRTSLFITSPYDAPTYAGNKPAGYIISSSEDMGRWARIQMGIIEDIPESFKAVIEKSHKGDKSVLADNGMYYGGGWSVNEDRTLIEHEGVNPNFSSQVTMFPKEEIAISLLTNSAYTNKANIVEGIKKILEGNLEQSYDISATQIWDMILSIATITFLILAILIYILRLYKKEKNNKNKRRLSPIWMSITLLILIFTLLLPGLLGYSWGGLLVWQPYSLLTVLISLSTLSASITYFHSK